MQRRRAAAPTYIVVEPTSAGTADQVLAVTGVSGSVLTLGWVTPISYFPIAVISSTASGGTYGTSGVDYTPLVQGATDNVTFQFAAPVAGTARLRMPYAMSAANSGDVRLTLSKLVVTNSGDPNAALSASSTFTVTPGNDALKHEVTDAIDASFAFSVAAGDVVRVKIERPTASDTHTGDMRILELWVSVS
jgi:hypothetical protein